MKEGVMDILEFLFDHYMLVKVAPLPDHEHLSHELEQAGFEVEEIDKAMIWLEGLGTLEEESAPWLKKNSLGLRVFTSAEAHKLGKEAMGLLYQLEIIGILDAVSREIIVDRVMAFEEEVTFEDFKQIVAFVILKQDHSDSLVGWAEHFLFESEDALIKH